MISPGRFYDTVRKGGVGFFTGVPDSLLKHFCAYVTDNSGDGEHIIAANEGCATGMAAGYHLATGGIPLIYMQNSGIGNAVNPLMSLMDPDVYSMPCILLIGWRGEPGVHDEPQHVKQGKVTCTLMEAMGIPYEVLSSEEIEVEKQLERCFSDIRERSAPFALIVRKGLFSEYKLRTKAADVTEFTREAAIEAIVETCPDAFLISTTGKASRELYEIRERRGEGHSHDFLTVGSMGHASQIALAVAKQRPLTKVICLDGDGAAIMHMGGMATVGNERPRNLVHVVLNNRAHDSVGGQPTVSSTIDMPSLAKALGYPSAVTAGDAGALADAVSGADGLTFVEAVVRKGSRADLGRPKMTPLENKGAFEEALRDRSYRTFQTVSLPGETR